MGLSDLFIDVDTLPAGGYGTVQLLTLLFFYSYILFSASDMISDGSELLLLVPSLAGIVGSVVLPVLGAVPDGAIVLFSGMGPDAQSQLSVGIGALAGSTIMLLTLPWVLSVVAGRVNIDPNTGEAIYRRPAGVAPKDFQKLSPPGNCDFSLTGVVCTPLVRLGGYIMLLTAISYLIIQGPAFFLTGTEDEIADGEHNWALAGFIVCMVSFFAYLAYQWYLAQSGDEAKELKREEILKERIYKGDVSLLGVMRAEMALQLQDDPVAVKESSSLLRTQLVRRLENILRPFYDRYDVNSDGSLDIDELNAVFRDMHENLHPNELREMFSKFDRDGNGSIDYREFVLGTAEYITSHYDEIRHRRATASLNEVYNMQDDDEGEDEEAEEVPEDLADLSPEEQQSRIRIRSFWMMGVGTLLVLLFSDPMVDVLDEVGNRTGISSFYISFVLAPLASNASELIAAYNYSLKKTSKTITISLTTLEGAACMNNTFCLGIFMILIYTQHLAWEFSAETISILFVEIVMALFAFRKTHNMWVACAVASLYPISLALVAGLEAMGLD